MYFLSKYEDACFMKSKLKKVSSFKIKASLNFCKEHPLEFTNFKYFCYKSFLLNLTVSIL